MNGVFEESLNYLICLFLTINLIKMRKSFKTIEIVIFMVLSSILFLLFFNFRNKDLIVSFIVFTCSVFVFRDNLFYSLFNSALFSVLNYFSYLSFNIVGSSMLEIKTLTFSFFSLILYKYISSFNIKNMLLLVEKSNFIKSTFLFLLIIISIIKTDNLLMQTSLSLSLIIILYYQIKLNILNKSIIEINNENKKIKEFCDNIRLFKHDYSNTLCSIGGYISLNDIEGLRKYYNSLTDHLSLTSVSQQINSTIINEPSIYNLLITKYRQIMKYNINFDFYSTVDYRKLWITPYDFTKILGILLDNAIDASKMTKERKLSLYIDKNIDNKITVILSNSYINKDIDIGKIYEKGYSTKDYKTNSGLGLWEVAQSIKKLKNVELDTSKSTELFTQQLIITQNVLERHLAALFHLFVARIKKINIKYKNLLLHKQLLPLLLLQPHPHPSPMDNPPSLCIFILYSMQIT